MTSGDDVADDVSRGTLAHGDEWRGVVEAGGA